MGSRSEMSAELPEIRRHLPQLPSLDPEMYPVISWANPKEKHMAKTQKKMGQGANTNHMEKPNMGRLTSKTKSGKAPQ